MSFLRFISDKSGLCCLVYKTEYFIKYCSICKALKNACIKNSRFALNILCRLFKKHVSRFDQGHPTTFKTKNALSPKTGPKKLKEELRFLTSISLEEKAHNSNIQITCFELFWPDSGERSLIIF